MSLASTNLQAPTESVQPQLRRRISGVQLLLAVLLTVGLLLALNFSSRMQLDRELQAIHDGVVAEIDALISQQQDLIDELNYVKSDAYVEFWARDEGKMIRDGEILILPQSDPASAPAPGPDLQLFEFVTSPPKPQNWELWWSLFFDGPPPGR